MLADSELFILLASSGFHSLLCLLGLQSELVWWLIYSSEHLLIYVLTQKEPGIEKTYTTTPFSLKTLNLGYLQHLSSHMNQLRETMSSVAIVAA